MRPSRGIVAVVAVALGLLVAGMAPVSGWALEHGDVLVALGHREAGLSWYRTVARTTPSASVRRRAWRRAALVARVDLGDPARVAGVLHGWLATETAPRARARILAQVAELETRRGRLEAAATAWQRAVDEAPGAPAAPERLLARAEVLAELGRSDAADEDFARAAATAPHLRGRANVGRARIAQARGDAHEALMLYDDAARHATSEEVSAVARLGSAACLERLGDLEEALATLDASELPEPVHAVRSDGLRRREHAVRIHGVTPSSGGR